MKRYNFLAILLALAFSIVSCSDFLEEKQVNTLTQDFYNSEEGLESLVIGCYGVFRAKVEWNDNGSGMLLELGTDQFTRGNETPIATYTVGSWSPGGYMGNTAVSNYLGHNRSSAGYGMYPSINNANIAIEKILNVAPGRFAQSTHAELRLAEVLFIRSWIYYSLTAQLGEVPLILEPNVGMPDNFAYPKSTVEAIYKRIIADLRRAYEGAPTTTNEQGRITKWAVGHLLAKCYLARAQAVAFGPPTDADRHAATPTVENINRLRYKGNVASDLDSCIIIATEVINGNVANNAAFGGLESDFFSLFRIGTNNWDANNAREVLLAAQFSNNQTLNAGYGQRICNYFIGAYDFAGGNCNFRTMEYGRPFATYKPTDFVYDLYDKVNDSRYYKTFRFDFFATNSSPSSLNWNETDAEYFNEHLRKPSERLAEAGEFRNFFGERGVLFVENTYDEPLDSAWVAAQPFILTARWIQGKNGAMYYRAAYRGVGNPSSMQFVGLMTGITNQFAGSKKYVDPNRGGGTDPASEAGTRNVILARLAEVYLIRAEANGRKGEWAAALDDINVLRNRAAYKAGENRDQSLVEFNPQGFNLPSEERVAPYAVTNSTFDAIKVTEAIFTPGTPESDKELYTANVRANANKTEMFVHFIYNEKAREFHSELLSWEDQANAGILYDRANFFNQMASSLRTPGQAGYGPAATVIGASGGQDGMGKGSIGPLHMIRMWPQRFLNNLTTLDGLPLVDADTEAYERYQNPGYR